jgi:hypothetical protein
MTLDARSLEYFNRAGHPVTRERWQQLSRQPDYARLVQTDSMCHGQQIMVITYWLGVRREQDTCAPLLFQTYGEICGSPGRRIRYYRTWDWTTLDAAWDGHLASIDWLTEVAASYAVASPAALYRPGRNPAPGARQVTAGRMRGLGRAHRRASRRSASLGQARTVSRASASRRPGTGSAEMIG